MNETPFQYQIKGAEWLSQRKVALLADDMGLGKSAQSIIAADLVGADRILVLCPAVARPNWLREFSKFSDLFRPFDLVHTKSFRPNHRNSIICSYDLAGDFDPRAFGDFDLLIGDEWHFLKNLEAKRTQTILGKENGYVRHTKRVWALTGTPAPNHAGELWPLLYTFGATRYPYEQFVETFCTYIRTGYGRQITGTRRDKIPELQVILSRVMLRRTAEEVGLQLPKMFVTDLVVEPGPVELDQESIDKIAREYSFLGDLLNRGALDSKDMRVLEGLAKSCSTLRKYVGLQKVRAVSDLVAHELACKHYRKIVIFGEHREVLSQLYNNLAGFGAVMVRGDTTPDQKQNNIDRFQNDPTCQVFIGNLKSAGTSITLTAANHCICIEQAWVPGDNAQAIKRIHRIGQTLPVFTRMIAVADSYDERVVAVVKRKTSELLSIFDKNSLQKDYDAFSVGSTQ